MSTAIAGLLTAAQLVEYNENGRVISNTNIDNVTEALDRAGVYNVTAGDVAIGAGVNVPGLVQIAGTPVVPRTLTFPAASGTRIVENATGQVATVECDGGASVDLAPGELALLRITPTTIRRVATPEAALADTNAFIPLTDAATVVWDTQGKSFGNAVVTLGGNRVLSLLNLENGFRGALIIKQDATGGRTLALPAGSLAAGGNAGALDLTAAGNAIDRAEIFYDGTTIYWSLGHNFT